MFYLCEDSISLDTLTTSSAVEASLFLFNHPNAWFLKYSDDGAVSFGSLVEDL